MIKEINQGIIANTFIWSICFYWFTQILNRYRIITWVAFTVIPFASLPYLYFYTEQSWFAWAKFYSIAAAATTITLLKSTDLLKYKFFQFFSLFLCAGNILEAGLLDLQSRNYINMFVALSLMLTISGPKAISIGKVNNKKWFLYDIPFEWALAYTIWNFVFVYGNYNEFAPEHFAILLVSLIFTLKNHLFWAEARIYSLALWLIGSSIIYDWLKIPVDKSMVSYRSDVNQILQLFSLLFAVNNLKRFFDKGRRNKFISSWQS